MPVLGGNSHQRKAEAVKFGQHLFFAFQSVNLVNHTDGGQAQPADMRRKVFVQRQQTVPPVHHKSHAAGVLHGGFGLPQNIGLETADAFGAFGDGRMGVQRDAARVHNAEGTLALAPHDAFHAIARDAGTVVRDGAVAADQTIEQGGFAHIGPSDEDDAWQGCAHGSSFDVRSLVSRSKEGDTACTPFLVYHILF